MGGGNQTPSSVSRGALAVFVGCRLKDGPFSHLSGTLGDGPVLAAAALLQALASIFLQPPESVQNSFPMQRTSQ